MDMGDLKELKAEDHGTRTSPQERKCSLSKMRTQSGSRGTEPELNAAESLAVLSARPVSMSHQGWGERGGGEQESPSSMLHVNPAASSSMTDTCSPFSPLCSATGSAWDALRFTSQTPGCYDRDPVNAAAHLHLLGESLSLIGQHLRETDKMVCTSASLSLLLDSLLCALAPLICLTAQIPELRNCTQPTLASTLENISYVMPGL